MIITDEAKQLLESVFHAKGVKGLRLFPVAGCCGSHYALTLDEPLETDTIETVNGIQVAFDAEVSETVELTLDREDTEEGPALVLISGGGCGCGSESGCGCNGE